MNNLIKSINSNCTATKDEIFSRASCVVRIGTFVTSKFIGSTQIAEYRVGRYEYVLTFINAKLIALELKSVYCFLL